MRRGGSIGVPSNWRVKLCNCVELVGLHGDRVGLHSLLGRRPSLIAHQPEGILRYLRMCQHTALATIARTSASEVHPAPHRAGTESQSSPITTGKLQKEVSRAANEPEKQRPQESFESRSPASSDWPEKIPPKPSRDKVFISYSHKDSKFLDELLNHLKPLERAGLVAKWSDKEIAPGSQWFSDIQAALASTRVAVMMVTPSFLASDFIHDHELGPFLKEAEQGGVRILWIPVRACSYKETPLKNHQAVGDPDKPLAQMKAERDGAWVKVCEEIKKALQA
jgi:TIR domain-containing protein